MPVDTCATVPVDLRLYGILDIGFSGPDPDRLAEAMITDQRTALRATLLALLERDDALRQTLRIRIVAEPAGPVAEVRCELPMGDSAVRTDLAPFFAVLRFVFTELDLAMMPTTLTLRCRYDHP